MAARHASAVPSQWGTDVTGVLRRTGGGGIALTLDACGSVGGKGYDRALIDGLVSRKVPATLFLNQRWIDANPVLARTLAGDPLFEIGNHGTAHKPLSVTGRSAYGLAGTRSAREAADEVYGNHRRIQRLTGRAPRFFRAGTAHYDEVAVAIVGDLGERVAGFSVNADNGATAGSALVRANVAAAGPGDIVLAHMNHPGGGTAAGLLAAVDDHLARGTRFVRLR
ncbi:MAG: polysaccharide deacetylase family protein [Gordonia sp. (in: high G+C Gram-positive bacteria)]|uniref:polysaccharide deacetylase family protein n=1 Tax=Gordonia sp. (in: high G+C Gram-positive bacteria) TaxID=84139 RepID=UPI0039E4BBB7